jgi:MFS family permease
MAWFIILEMLSGLNLGYGLTYLNQCASLLYVKNEWASVNEKTWHISVLGSSMIVGQWLGSGIAGKLMRESRRRALLVSIILGVFGCLMTLINVKIFWLLNFGRFLYGISSGIGSVVTPRFIEDFTPLYLYAIIATSFVFSQMVGIFLALSDAYILPS